MLQLNDDCLLLIFRELNTREQLGLTRTCMRFRDVVVKLLWRYRYREFCNNSEEIKTLSEKEHQELFALIVLNLKKLTIWYRAYMKSQATFYFTIELPFLVELNCQDPCNMHDSHIRLIAKNCVNLRVLRLSWCSVTGAYMKDLRQLRELYVPACWLRNLHLQAIMRKLPLTHLDTTGNVSVDCKLRIVLGKLQYTNLRELHISEDAINEKFIGNFHKLRSLKMLQVNEIGFENLNNTHWPRLLQAVDARTKALHIENTTLLTSAVRIAKNLSLLNKLQKLYFLPPSDMDIVDESYNFREKLNLDRKKNMLASLELFSNCAALEHIYFYCYDLVHDEILFKWANKLIQLLASETKPRPVVNIHIKEDMPDKFALNLMLKKLAARYPLQRVVKWVWEPMSTSFLPLGQSFVCFEFE